MNTFVLKERDITRTVREYLELRGWSSVRINAGPFGKAGMADYVFLHYHRRLILWVEFKAPGGRLSAKQIEWMAAESAKGAMCQVVNDIDGFIEWYERTFGEQGQLRLKP